MARADISYDYEDFGMTAEELQVKYDREHPVHTNLNYNSFIAPIQTGVIPCYWTWVVQQIAKDDDEIPGNDAQGNPGEVVPIADINLFAGHLVAWHNRKIAILEHMLSVPEGTEITVNINGDEKAVILTGDALVAFRGGITTALGELGELPFQAIPVESEAVPEAPQTSEGNGSNVH